MPTLRLPCQLFAAACLLAPAAVSAAPAMPAAGLWEGTIGAHPIILCAGPARQLSYRYQNQQAFIALADSGEGWSESVNGMPTGSWRIAAQAAGTMSGTWSDPGNKKHLPLTLKHASADSALCSDPGAGAPSTTRLALPTTPQPAARDAGAVVRPDGSLWTWGVHTRNVPVRKGNNYVQVALGPYHTAALKADGSLWAWGANANCQLGPDLGGGEEPVQIGSNFKYVAAATEYTVAIKVDGSLWSWGGEPTPGKFSDGEPCTTRPALLGKGFTVVSAHERHFAALKADGTLWMWGNGYNPEAAATGDQSPDSPRLVGRDFAQVSVGYGHTVAVKKDGSLWAWGSNGGGELGDGTKEARTAPVKIGEGYVQASAGLGSTAAVKADGSLWAWGANRRGLMGDCREDYRTRPTKVATEIARVEVGRDFLLAIRRDGSAWTWGWFWDGEQSDTSLACRKGEQVVFGNGVNPWDQPVGKPLVPVRAVPAPASIADVTAAGAVTAVVGIDGNLWTWGNNIDGQLADGSKISRNLPVLAARGVRSASAERGNLTVLNKDGSAWRWGVGTVGREPPFVGRAQALRLGVAVARIGRSGYQQGRVLGLGADGILWDWPYAYQMDKAPVAVGRQVAAIGTGAFGSFALRTDGSLWKVADYPVNAPARIGRDFVRVAGSADHAYAIKADGSLWAWGNNDFHQLGDPADRNQSEPVQIGTGFAEVAAGRFHGLALKFDGTLWAWGHNESGAVGDGTTTDRRIPVKLGSGYSKIAAGDYHSVAVKADGSIWAWGNNEDGQLGDGSNVRRLAPVRIDLQGARATAAVAAPAPPADGATQVAVGYDYACALLANGEVSCWGRNQDGQLGQREPGEPRLVPQRVPGVAQATAIAALYGRTCALQKNGHALCWGKEVSGGPADMGTAPEGLRSLLVARFGDDQKCKMFKSGNITGHCNEVCAAAKAAPSFCQRAIGKYPYLREALVVVSDNGGGSGTYCGLLKNGKVQCFNSNYANVGPVDNIDDAVALEISGANGCAVQRNGRVKCWGNNEFGQLGNGKLERNYDSNPPAVTVVNIAN